MKSTRNVRLITDVITKRTTTTTTAAAKAATAEQLSTYYEPTCPHGMVDNQNAPSMTIPPPTTYDKVRPYDQVPGPKPLPILGNTWR